MTELPFATITELARAIRGGEIGPVELTEKLLDRIGGLDGKLHAFIGLTAERAMDEARAAEAALARGDDLGPLHGIPYAAKDLFDVAGEATTAGTHLLTDNIAAADCAAVRRLAAAGMVLLGKTHTVQFAATIIGINHDQGTPHNPWHAEPHVPGGSSSGSGVAVGGGLAPMALGTDTGGSVRAPSSLCGTVGLKTTVGRVSRAGVYPLSWTLDSVGPLTRSVEDAALVYQALRGFDADDDTTLHLPEQDVLANLKSGVQGLRLAFGETMFFDDLDPEVEAAVRASGAVFRELGATVDGIELPEAAATREIPDRLAGIAVEAYHYNRRLLDDHADELDPVILWLALGKEMAAPDYFALLRRRAELRRAIIERLRDVDALLVPTTPMPARPVALVDADPASHDAHARPYARNTSTGNFLNLCAVSLPCGFTNDGLPIGLMIYAKPYHEEMALRVAHAYEQATDWHFRRPDLSWAS